MEKPFAGKKALVIGGTGGIGRAVALGLAERGAELTIHGGSSLERLENTLKTIKKLGGKGEGFLLSIDNLIRAEEIFARAPDPDILVCAWGPFRRAPLDRLDLEFWQGMVMGNLAFPGLVVSLALPKMIERNWGRILLFGGTNTDSIRGFLTSAAYSAAKTGLGVLAKSVAKHAAAQGISCNVICPGLTDTEYLDDNEKKYNRDLSPGNQALSPENIAWFCMEILENPGINGAVIPVDRGISL